MSEAKIIAFYLPQYHPTPDNDKWWGKGFTEWTNVGKAKPLFRGHYQPKVPADLGYYDLRLPEVREAQAELAKEAGIYGFCYYHYWFGNGKEELELPFNEVLRLGKPDFPFMLCWANESWHRKFWNKDGKGTSKEVLIEQKYPGEEDVIAHFYRLLPAFKDSRYIHIENKPAFMIYKPEEFAEIDLLIKLWNKLAIKEGLQGVYFIGCIWTDLTQSHVELLISKGFNAVNTLGIWKTVFQGFGRKAKNWILNKLSIGPIKIPYKKISKTMFSSIDGNENVFPTIIPNWDHTPRSGKNGTVFMGTSPRAFHEQAIKGLEIIRDKQNNYLFLKSWNEWGEGNYMEPDLEYGHGYIESLKQALDYVQKE